MSMRRPFRSSAYSTFMIMLLALLTIAAVADAGNGKHAKKQSKNRCKNALYLIDNTRNGDGMSIIYRVKPKRRLGQAHLREITRLPYDRAHIAMGPRCRRLYAVQNGNVRLGYYDMAADTFTDMGPLDIKGVVQASFNREGQLHIASGRTNQVYIVDQDDSGNLLLQEIGGVTAPDSTDVNIGGADLVFTPDGAMYVMTRKGGNVIYEIADETAGLTANRVFNGVGKQATGLAFLPRNPRYLAYSTRDLDQLVIVDRLTGQVVDQLDMMLNGQAFDAKNGDMTVSMRKCHCGPRPRCNAPGGDSESETPEEEQPEEEMPDETREEQPEEEPSRGVAPSSDS